MHRKGLHCGSTAMGDALRAKGLDLPEETLFGLGAGLDFTLHDGDTGMTPPQASRFFVGRSPSFERDLCAAVGATLHEEHFDEVEAAWARIEELLSAGELPLVYTDLFELPYLGAHGHWFGHLVAVQSADAHVLDNEFDQPQAIEPSRLQRALCTPLPVRGQAVTILHVTGRPGEPSPHPSIAMQGRRMTAGVARIREFAAQLPELQQRSDWARIARLTAQVIEVRGNGGGLFRRMYARFLRDARPDLAPWCEEAADRWTALAGELSPHNALACAEAEAALWARA